MFLPTSSSPASTATILLLLFSRQYYSCLSFSPPLIQPQHSTTIASSVSGVESTASSIRHQLSPLHVITKRQSLILDGAELSYYMEALATEHLSSNSSDDSDNNGSTINNSNNNEASQLLPDVAPRSLKKRQRIASISFVTAVLEEEIVQKNGEIINKGAKIVGIEAVQQTHEEQQEEGEENDSRRQGRSIITIENNVQLYQDSIAVIPPSLTDVSDADIIATAAASLSSGVHFTINNNTTTERNSKRAVIVGGGDHAIFLAKALVAFNVKTYLVTARPTWSLPSPQDIVSSNDEEEGGEDLIEIMSPAVGAMSLGFTLAIGEFDILIDTLGDEMGKGRARTLNTNSNGYYDIGQSSSLQQWKELHGCTSYISTITRSQQYVLGKGLLFARDAVIRYQKEVESIPTLLELLPKKKKKKKKEGVMIPSVPPPRNFGNTIQSLLEKQVIYQASSNEVGSQRDKSTFVRGWSLSDLTELKTWPRASEGAGRFGFPVFDLNAAPRIRPTVKGPKKKGVASSTAVNKSSNVAATKEASSTTSELTTSSESMVETTVNATTSTRQIKVTKSSTKMAATSNNPYVTTINSASELNQGIVEAQRNCILFLTASYCQKCKRLTPQFQRMARKSSSHSSSNNSSSPNNDNVLFAHVDISAGPKGKQLGKLLNVEKVPSVIVFQNGNQVRIDGEESSIVVERGNMNRLEEVADALDKEESQLKLKELLSVQEAIQK